MRRANVRNDLNSWNKEPPVIQTFLRDPLTSVLPSSRSAVGEHSFYLCFVRCLPMSERSLAFQLSIGIHNRETTSF